MVLRMPHFSIFSCRLGVSGTQCQSAVGRKTRVKPVLGSVSNKCDVIHICGELNASQNAIFADTCNYAHLTQENETCITVSNKLAQTDTQTHNAFEWYS